MRKKEELKKEHAELLEKIYQAGEKLNNILRAINKSKLETQNVVKEKEAAVNGMKRAEEDLSVTEAKLNKKRDDLKKINNEIDRTSKKLTLKRREESACLHNIDLLNGNIKSLKLEEERLQDKINELRGKLTELSLNFGKEKDIQLRKLEDVNQKIKQGEETYKEKISLYENKLAKLKEQEEGIIQGIKEKEEALSFLEKREQNVKQNIKNALRNIESKNEDISELVSRKSEILNQINVIKEKQADAEGRLEELLQKIGRLNRRDEYLNMQENYIEEQFKRAGIPYKRFEI